MVRILCGTIPAYIAVSEPDPSVHFLWEYYSYVDISIVVEHKPQLLWTIVYYKVIGYWIEEQFAVHNLIKKTAEYTW